MIPWRLSKLIGYCFLPLVTFAPVSSALAAPTVFESIGGEVNKVFESTRDSVVRVRAYQGEGSFATVGSGFYIDNKGTLLTATAILGPSTQIEIETNGQSLPAEILMRDLRSGLALLRVFNGTTPFLRFGDSTELKTASPVIGIGYPLNLPSAPTFGMITGFDSQYLQRFFCTTHLRTSLAISPGQIGGPMLNTRGEVVGIIVMAADERKFTYALPTQAIQKIITDVAMNGQAQHGWVGVGVIEAPYAPGNERRVKISQFFNQTPASNSGLQAGDIVVRIDKREIYRPADVIDASFYAKVGQELPVVVLRDGKLLTYKFVVGERPSSMPIAVPQAVPLELPVSRDEGRAMPTNAR